MDEQKLIQKIGQNIKRIREKKGITQIDLAYECGFEKGNMSRIEAGRTNPTIKTLAKIAEALGVSITDIIKP